jgi:hypothetical protein
VPDRTSRHGKALASPRVPRHQTPPHVMGGLWRHHVSHGARPCLSAREGSGIATCPTMPDPASRHGRALVSPCVPWRHTPPLDTGGLRRRHVSHSARPRLLAREGSGSPCVLWHQTRHLVRKSSDITMCHMAPDPPPGAGGLWHRHVPHGS